MNKKYFDEEIDTLSDFDDESNPEKSAVNSPNMYGFKGFTKPNQSFENWRQAAQK